MRRICLFCGSRDSTNPNFLAAASELGRVLAERGVSLSYGGSSKGLMNAAANAAMAGGGEVIGVMPNFLVGKEGTRQDLSKMVFVETLAERKAMLAEMSDAFIVLPGGIGTLDELTEVWTWRHLGVHHKPIGILNMDGYYDGLLAFFETVKNTDFIGQTSIDMLAVADTVPALVDELLAQIESADEAFARQKVGG